MNSIVDNIVSTAKSRFKYNVSDEDKKTIFEWLSNGASERMVTEAIATTYNNTGSWNIRYTNKVVENMIKDGITDDKLDDYKNKHSQKSKNNSYYSDKVAVVRCKDCKRSERKIGQHYNCSLFKHNMCEDDYCSLGSLRN